MRLDYNMWMPRLTVEGSGTIEVEDGRRLVLGIEQDAHVDIMHACGGLARCTTCPPGIRPRRAPAHDES